MKSKLWMVLTAVFALSGFNALAVNYDPADLYSSIAWESPNDTSPIYASPDSSDPKSWSQPTTSLSWNIFYNNDIGMWSYSYKWQTSDKNLSHIIFEISEDAVLSDFSNFSGNLTSIEIGTWGTEGNSNPGIPGELYGVKVNTPNVAIVNGLKEYDIQFLSTRYPTWGDFYAKDGSISGSEVYAYNQGFLAEDKDDGLHILVPDSGTGLGPWDPNYNPNPTADAGTTVSLIGLALLGIEGIRRRLS